MAAAAWLLAAVTGLSGCAAQLVVEGVALVAKGLSPNKSRWVETHRMTLAYPLADVYGLVGPELEHNGRKVSSRDDDAHSALVSYPFSLLKNNWGGSIRLTCTATEFGTTVVIDSDGRDIEAHVRAVGDEVLADLERALRQRPRTL